ncbi:hypothetical protein [Actinokineospora inagensis]|uniref:hypothetical protein n=1 Tax=Actinokineospora inagensis TaxID=103730 RepID=UPI00068757DE|nr:hypothetical protein [Actinokineospora inagensis]
MPGFVPAPASAIGVDRYALDLLLHTEQPMSAHPWEKSELMRRLHHSALGPETIEQVSLAVEGLCCDYAWRSPHDLLAEARAQLDYLSTHLNGPCTLTQHRDLLIQAGWLLLLSGCVEYDIGQRGQADRSRQAALRIGQETGVGEIIGWSFEMLAWFALTRGDLTEVGRFAQAGVEAAGSSSVAVQLKAQAAKAAARLGDTVAVDRVLDDGYTILARHDRPARPDNHFVVDPAKWDFYAMDCYRVVGQNHKAHAHAREVLKLGKAPMRVTEAQLTLAVLDIRAHDLDGAAHWVDQALAAERKSIDSLLMVATEVERGLAGDKAGERVLGPIRQARESYIPR